MSAPAILDVRDLCTHFSVSRRGLFQQPLVVRAVDGVSFQVRAHATFGLVGESGSGKSTTAMSLLRLIEPTGGRVLFHGEDILHYDAQRMRQVRRRVQVVFQDPYSSLNPKWRVADIIREPLDILREGTRSERDRRVAEMLELVGLRPEHQRRYPNEFSGGQRQRIAIARALSTRPELVVCDEIVSALDVAIQAKILNLMTALQKQLGVAFLFISHDLSVVHHFCHDVGVMYLGRIVEQGPREVLFGRPLHPYTQVLLSAVPRVGSQYRNRQDAVIPDGDPPNPLDIPTGCRFSGRCPFAIDKCHQREPLLRQIGTARVACHRVGDNGAREWLDQPGYAPRNDQPAA